MQVMNSDGLLINQFPERNRVTRTTLILHQFDISVWCPPEIGNEFPVSTAV